MYQCSKSSSGCFQRFFCNISCLQPHLKLNPTKSKYRNKDPCESASVSTRKLCEPLTSSTPKVWRRQSSNTSQESDVEQASFDLYQKSIKPYTAIRKIIKSNFQRREKKISLDPTKEAKIGITSICSVNMFSVGNPIQDSICKNQLLVNEQQLCKREYSNMNYSTKKLVLNKCKSTKGGSLKCICPQCNNTECTCEKGSTVEKYGRLTPRKPKQKGGCGNHNPEETSCGLVTEKPKRPPCKPKCSSLQLSNLRKTTESPKEESSCPDSSPSVEKSTAVYSSKRNQVYEASKLKCYFTFACIVNYFVNTYSCIKDVK